MKWEERVFLLNLFAEDIAKLEQMLGWDCSRLEVVSGAGFVKLATVS